MIRNLSPILHGSNLIVKAQKKNQVIVFTSHRKPCIISFQNRKMRATRFQRKIIKIINSFIYHIFISFTGMFLRLHKEDNDEMIKPYHSTMYYIGKLQYLSFLYTLIKRSKRLFCRHLLRSRSARYRNIHKIVRAM